MCPQCSSEPWEGDLDNIKRFACINREKQWPDARALRPAGSREPVVPEKSPNDAGQESMVPTPYLSGSMSIGGGW